VEEADAAADAGPDVPGAEAVDGEASADTSDCCMSEKRTDARFWFFVNLYKGRDQHKENGKMPLKTGEKRGRERSCEKRKKE